jgi:hypothetical protein
MKRSYTISLAQGRFKENRGKVDPNARVSEDASKEKMMDKKNRGGTREEEE